MARVRYIGAEPVTVPELGLGRIVHPDELVEVPDGRFDGYVGQTTNWAPVDPPEGWAPAETEAAEETARPALQRRTTKTAAKYTPQKEG